MRRCTLGSALLILGASACGGAPGFVAATPTSGSAIAPAPDCAGKLYLQLSNPTDGELQLHAYTSTGMAVVLDPLQPRETKRYASMQNAGLRSVLALAHVDQVVPDGARTVGPTPVEVSPRWICEP